MFMHKPLPVGQHFCFLAFTLCSVISDKFCFLALLFQFKWHSAKKKTGSQLPCVSVCLLLLLGQIILRANHYDQYPVPNTVWKLSNKHYGNMASSLSSSWVDFSCWSLPPQHTTVKQCLTHLSTILTRTKDRATKLLRIVPMSKTCG